MTCTRIKNQYLVMANQSAFGEVVATKEAAFQNFCNFLEETYPGSKLKRTEDNFPIFRVPFRRTLSDIYVKWTGTTTQSQIYMTLEVEETREKALSFLSKMDQELHSALRDDFYILTIHDEVSSIYSRRLFSGISTFERKLKELIMLIFCSEYGQAFYNIVLEKTALGNQALKEIANEANVKKEEVKKIDIIQDSIWKMELGKLQNFLFEPDIQKRYQNKAQNSTKGERIFIEEICGYLVKNDIKTEWDYLFAQFAPEWNAENDVDCIRKCRNHISHTNHIEYEEYKECKSALKRANAALSDAIMTFKPDITSKVVEEIRVPSEKSTDHLAASAGMTSQIIRRPIAIDYEAIMIAIEQAIQGDLLNCRQREEQQNYHSEIVHVVKGDQWHKPPQYHRKK